MRLSAMWGRGERPDDLLAGNDALRASATESSQKGRSSGGEGSVVGGARYPSGEANSSEQCVANASGSSEVVWQRILG